MKKNINDTYKDSLGNIQGVQDALQSLPAKSEAQCGCTGPALDVQTSLLLWSPNPC